MTFDDAVGVGRPDEAWTTLLLLAAAPVLERSQRILPMGLRYIDGVTHDYKQHGTTTLLAALDVLTKCRARHHQEFLGFLKHIDAAVPVELDVHLVAPHKHRKMRHWLAARRR